MATKNSIMNLLNSNHGVLTAADARRAGIVNKALQREVEAKNLERISHGLYISKSEIVDEYMLAQFKCEKAIYSHETALYFNNLCDRTPAQLMMTIPSGHNTRLLKDKNTYRFFYCKPELHALGVITMTSPYGHELRIYDKERTLCDCIKKRYHLDTDLVLSAIKQYMEEKKNDFSKLLFYAEKLKIREKLRQYMEVLV